MSFVSVVLNISKDGEGQAYPGLCWTGDTVMQTITVAMMLIGTLRRERKDIEIQHARTMIGDIVDPDRALQGKLVPLPIQMVRIRSRIPK